MTEAITQTRTEDAVAEASAFLQHERAAELDGGFASDQVGQRVIKMERGAQDVLESVPLPGQPGFYLPLSQHNAARFDEVATSLPGYMVLVPSSLVETGQASVFYPAVVSEDGLKKGVLRLHVLKQPYRQELAYGASVVLSGAGQSETEGVGEHGKAGGDGVEAEHFATLLAAGSDRQVQSAWQRGDHINHAWRGKRNGSVTSEVAGRLFGPDMPQQTITITRSQVKQGKAAILWHEGLRDTQTGRPETATRDNALVVIQALGYEALKKTNPRGTDDVKRMLAV